MIRYYNIQDSAQLPTKCLSEEEFTKLATAGLSVAVMLQQRGGDDGFLDDFETGKGKRDATRALELATAIGQPAGSAIYFGVDYDYFRISELAVIAGYFAEVNQVLGGRYRVGFYGSGVVCTRRTKAVQEYIVLGMLKNA